MNKKKDNMNYTEFCGGREKKIVRHVSKNSERIFVE